MTKKEFFRAFAQHFEIDFEIDTLTPMPEAFEKEGELVTQWSDAVEVVGVDGEVMFMVNNPDFFEEVEDIDFGDE